MSLPTLTNGVISYSDPTLGENTVATYTCNTGYTLNGDSTRTCGSDGVWSGQAQTCIGTIMLVKDLSVLKTFNFTTGDSVATTPTQSSSKFSLS